MSFLIPPLDYFLDVLLHPLVLLLLTMSLSSARWLHPFRPCSSPAPHLRPRRRHHHLAAPPPTAAPTTSSIVRNLTGVSSSSPHLTPETLTRHRVPPCATARTVLGLCHHLSPPLSTTTSVQSASESALQPEEEGGRAIHLKRAVDCLQILVVHALSGPSLFRSVCRYV
jgi:hypothetical protein